MQIEKEKDRFWEIRPYSGAAEEGAALKRISSHPLLDNIAAYLYPGQSSSLLRDKIASLESVDQFQAQVMLFAIEKIVENSVEKLSYSGFEKLKDLKSRLLISNHRDIMLDSALTQVLLHINHLPTSEMAVGDNLVTDPFLEDVARSNKMIKVNRSGSPKEIYNNSILLSHYIRERIESQSSSVWIAQRNGRTKNGDDITEQGVLKMLNMSGGGDFYQNFSNLSITPIAISYQIEPCDFFKARELMISQVKKYIKSPGEDLNSILAGLLNNKGNIHITLCDRLSEEELLECSRGERNERFQLLGRAIDQKIWSNYKIWDNNMIAFDMLQKEPQYSHLYSADRYLQFEEYLNSYLKEIDNKNEKENFRNIFLSIYANPLVNKNRVEGK
ncbi:MAG: 1-acyl-sn-glycerol-3-phosphate acyltransferase [Bacteroidales bacterium]